MAVGAMERCRLSIGCQQLRIQVPMVTEPDGRLIDRHSVDRFHFRHDSKFRFGVLFVAPDREFGMATEVREVQLKPPWRDLLMCLLMAVGTVCICHMRQNRVASMFLMTTGTTESRELRRQHFFQFVKTPARRILSAVRLLCQQWVIVGNLR